MVLPGRIVGFRRWDGGRRFPFPVERPYSRRQCPRRSLRLRTVHQLRQLRRLDDRGARRARTRPAPARHVYRRHRRARLSPPRRRGPRQRDGRGGRGTRQPDRGVAAGRQPPDRHRQRARHSDRSASEIPGQVGARSHHDDAPLPAANSTARPMRPRAACTASASPWSMRCRPKRWSRSRATRSCIRQRFSRGHAARHWRRWARRPTGAAPACLPPDPEIFGTSAHFAPARLMRLARSKAYLYAGVEIRWKCDPSLISRRHAGEATFQFPGGLPTICASRSAHRECATSQFFTGKQTFPGEPTAGRMGGRLAALVRGFLQLLLQHHPDARRRHA
jgi:hypothetical protein